MAKKGVTDKEYLFRDAPVGKALFTLAIPTIISQLINLIYNVADTFFVGRTGNPYMIAAVSLSFTIFMLTIPLGNLYGVGGGSHIARLLGVGKGDKAKNVSSFSFWMSIATGALYSVAILLFMNPILDVLGASDVVAPFAKQYLSIVVVIGGPFIIANAVMAHLLRNVGYSSQASIGLSGGGILNIVLDPLFMFLILPDGYQVFGAALATTFSNVASFVYFVVFINITKNKTGLSLSIKDFKANKRDVDQIFKVGIPSACLTVFFDIANMILNSLMANHGDIQLAALGIVMKVERFSTSIGIGMSISMLPIVAYNYSAKNYDRMKAVISTTRKVGLMITLGCVVLYELLAGPLVSMFISTKGSNAEDALKTIAYGTAFLRIRAFSPPFQLFNYHASNAFQGMGDGKTTMIHVLFRQVIFMIPLYFILDSLFGQYGLVAAFPIAEALGGLVAVLLLRKKLKRLK